MSSESRNSRVFVSSTTKDLDDFRDEVCKAVWQLDQFPIGMEAFPADVNTPANFSRARVAEADALIVLVAYRYGCVPEIEFGGDGRCSITWLEVQTAKEEGKPVYAFLIDPEIVWSRPRDSDRLYDEPAEKWTAILDEIRGLKAFKEYLQKHFTCKFFKNKDDLARKVTLALAMRGRRSE